jgi:hypothetical protein
LDFNDLFLESGKPVIWGRDLLSRLETEQQKQVELDDLESEVKCLATMKTLIAG